MNKKIILQLSLIIILVLILFIVFSKYFNKNKAVNLIDLKEIEKVKDQTIIKEIYYKSTNKNNDVFVIKADQGEIDFNDANVMHLLNVFGNIKMQNGDEINITSKFADFNRKSFETKFFQNIKILMDDEKIFGDSLYVVFDLLEDDKLKNPDKLENRAILTGNITIKRANYTLNADVIEIDLITKNSKVYMLDKKKVSIRNK